MCSASGNAECRSHLYNAIRSYLHSENRAQPIIGLNSIIEMLTYNQPPVYFCYVCFLRILKTDIRNHIVGSLHRYNYIKSHHSHGWRSYTDLTQLARPLMDLAKMVEQKEGTGEVQVLSVDEVIYKEMTSWPVPAAFGKLQRILNQQDPNKPIVHKSLGEGNKETAIQGLQKFENSDKIPSDASTQLVSTPPVSSKCLGVIEPLPKLSKTIQTSPSSKTPIPVRQLLQFHHASTSPNQMDGNILSNIESSLAPGIGQHINPELTVIQDKNQIPQSWMISSGTQCLTETRSVQISRTISVVRPPREWSPIRLPCRNNTVHANKEENQIRVSNRSHLLHLTETADAYKSQLQTSSLVPEKTQDPNNIPKSISDEPVNALDLKVIKPIISQRRTGASEEYFTRGYNSFYDKIDSKETFSTDFEANVETPVEKIPVLSRNPVTRTSSPSCQVKSYEGTPETYTEKKALIGLQAVIKCQSVDGNPPPCCYLCQLCSLNLKKTNIFSHLTSAQHRESYVKVFHPQLYTKMKHKHLGINEMLARQLEQRDGRGQIKVMRLSACLISEVLHRDYHWCMKILNCGASVEPFDKRLKKNTAPIQVLKRPAIESLSDNDGATVSTHLMPQKINKVDPTKVISTKGVKNPVFKVSLSLQEGPVVIERDSLGVTATVAPEIENQGPKSTYKENNALPFGVNRQFEVQTCLHSRPLTEHNPDEFGKTAEIPDGNVLTQTNVPKLNYLHTEVSHVHDRMFEDDVTSSVQYAYDNSQAIPVVEPTVRREDHSLLKEMDTYFDWPVEDTFFCSNDWISQRQAIRPSGISDPEYTRNMWY